MEENKDLINIATPIKDLEEKILEEQDIDKLKNIVDVFNINIKKKDLIRAGKLNDLQDKIVQEIEKRVDNKSDEFSNKDLSEYFKLIQDTLNKSDTTLDNIKTPAIQFNQVNINTEEPKLSRESRQRVLDAVNAILKGKQEQPNTEVTTDNVELEVVEVKDINNESSIE